MKDADISIESEPKTSLWRNLIRIHPTEWLAGIIVDMSTGAHGGFDGTYNAQLDENENGSQSASVHVQDE